MEIKSVWNPKAPLNILMYFSSGWMYDLIIKILHGNKIDEVYRIVSKEIGDLSVLDVCCGTAYISKFLKGNHYTGLDNNPQYVRAAKKKGLNVIRADVIKQDFPRADCVTCFASLYQFYPDHHLGLLEKMKSAAKHKVIVTDNISPLARSYFNESQFKDICKGARFYKVGKLMIAVFDIK